MSKVQQSLSVSRTATNLRDKLRNMGYLTRGVKRRR